MRTALISCKYCLVLLEKEIVPAQGEIIPFELIPCKRFWGDSSEENSIGPKITKAH